MKKLSAALLILLGLASAALAQTVTGPIPNSGVYGAYNVAPPTCTNGSGCWFQTDANGQLKVTGSLSSSIAGFTPGLTYATLTASGSSASVALPAGATVAFQNTGTTTVSCTLGVGSATAVAGQIQVPPSSTIFLTVGSNTFGACIDESGSVSNVVRLAGGAGLGTGFGGGGGSGGGSSSITNWGGGVLGAMANYGTSPGAVLVPGVNAFITNTPTVTANAGTNLNTSALALSATQGATTAAPATTPTTTAAETEISLLKAVTNAAVTPLNNTSVAINVSTATTTQLVALSGATLIYVTSYDVIAGGTGNITFVYGTGASCGTGTTSLTGPYPLTAQAGIAKGSGIGTILRVPAGNALCVTTSAAVQMSGSVSYQQF